MESKLPNDPYGMKQAELDAQVAIAQAQAALALQTVGSLYSSGSKNSSTAKAAAKGNKAAAMSLALTAEGNAVSDLQKDEDSRTEDEKKLADNLELISRELSGIADFVEDRDEREEDLYREAKYKERSRPVAEAAFAGYAAGKAGSGDRERPRGGNKDDDESFLLDIAKKVGMFGGAHLAWKKFVSPLTPMGLKTIAALPVAVGGTEYSSLMKDYESSASQREKAGKIGSSTHEENLAKAGTVSGAVQHDLEASRIYTDNASKYIMGSLGFVLGNVLGAFGGNVLGERFANWLSGSNREEKYRLLGITEEDVVEAQKLATGGDAAFNKLSLEIAQAVSSGLMTPEEAEAKKRRIEKAIKAVVYGIGDAGVQDTWNVNWGIGELDLSQVGTPETVADVFEKQYKSSGTPGTINESMREALFKASSDIYLTAVKNVEESEEYKALPSELKKASYMQREILKNRLSIGKTGEFVAKENVESYDHPGAPSDRNFEQNPYDMGIAVDLDVNTPEGIEILRSYGFMRIKGDPRPHRFFNVNDERFKELVRKGLWTDSEDGTYQLPSVPVLSGEDEVSFEPGLKLRQVIEAGKEPEYLSLGGVLHEAVSLGRVPSGSITSLEESGREIADALRAGLDGMNSDVSEAFDGAMMDYLMEAVLPGLVSAMKKEEGTPPGMTSTVKVFG